MLQKEYMERILIILILYQHDTRSISMIQVSSLDLAECARGAISCNSSLRYSRDAMLPGNPKTSHDLASHRVSYVQDLPPCPSRFENIVAFL